MPFTEGQAFKKQLASTSQTPSFTIVFGTDVPASATRFCLCGIGWSYPASASGGSASVAVTQGGNTFFGCFFSTATLVQVLPIPMVFESTGGTITVSADCGVNGNSRVLFVWGYWQ